MLQHIVWISRPEDIMPGTMLGYLEETWLAVWCVCCTEHVTGSCTYVVYVCRCKLAYSSCRFKAEKNIYLLRSIALPFFDCVFSTNATLPSTSITVPPLSAFESNRQLRPS